MTAREREHVASVAAQKRVALGLSPVAPEDLEYEARRAEAQAARRRKRRVVAARTQSPPPPAPDCDIDIRERVGDFWVEVKLHWTHERGSGERWAWSALLFWEDDVRVRLSDAELGAHPSQAEALGELLDALAMWCEHYPALA